MVYKREAWLCNLGIEMLTNALDEKLKNYSGVLVCKLAGFFKLNISRKASPKMISFWYVAIVAAGNS